MKFTLASLVALAAANIAYAQSTERNVSVPDAVPACMERNGPDCILRSDMVTPRVAPQSQIVVVPPVAPPPTDTSGLLSTKPVPPSSGLIGSNNNTIVVTPSGSSNPTSSGFTTNPNSIGGNLQSSGGTTGTSTSSGFTTNPNSIGGGLSSGPVSTPGTATTGAGALRR